MKRLDLKVGFSCNNKCLFCVQGDKRFKYGDKTTEELCELLKKNYDNECEGVVFTGGEVTIRKDLIELVSYAKELGYKYIQIQTNGRMLSYKDYCLQLIEAGVNEFAPALHGSTPKIHDSLTQANGSFDQVTKGIKNLRELGLRVITNTVITKQNYADLPNIAKKLVELDVYQFQFAFVHILGSAAQNAEDIVPKKSDVMPYVKEALDIGIKAGKIVMTEAIPFCLMKDYEKCVAERIIPDTTIEDAAWTIDNYNETRVVEGKDKREECKECKYYLECEGPWKEYPKIYGWDEFKPVKN